MIGSMLGPQTDEYWYIFVEDPLGAVLAEKLLRESGRQIADVISNSYGGASKLQQKLPELIKLASHCPVLLLTDLDQTPCPVQRIADWCSGTRLPPGLLFRVAVREVEAWLLADQEGFAAFSGVPLAQLRRHIPETPESLADPKRSLLDLVRRYGRLEIKRALLPDKGAAAKVGPGYNAALTRFVREHWTLARATPHAPSLRRTVQRIRSL